MTNLANDNSDTYTKSELYAALKLIEQLYVDGHIPRLIYQNIVKEYYQKCS